MAAIDPHFRLRIPEDLKARVERAAEENSRSITAEIVYRLKGSFGVEASETDMLDRRIRETEVALRAAQAERARVDAEIEVRSRALDEALRARDQLNELEDRKRAVSMTVRKATS